MIATVSNLQVILPVKSYFAVELAATQVGSEFNNTVLTKWFGDLLTVESLFPQWILKEYNDDPSNVTIVGMVKNYFRWLFSLEQGYGAQLDWENIRVPLYMNSIFLEALADFYFTRADFSQEPLASILPNIRTFATKVDANYFNIKGTPNAIKYLICSLLGFSWTDIYVISTSYCVMQIQVSGAQYSSLLQYKTFLEAHVIPAGVVVQYKVI
jgi:hypothetical protein